MADCLNKMTGEWLTGCWEPKQTKIQQRIWLISDSLHMWGKKIMIDLHMSTHTINRYIHTALAQTEPQGYGSLSHLRSVGNLCLHQRDCLATTAFLNSCCCLNCMFCHTQFLVIKNTTDTLLQQCKNDTVSWLIAIQMGYSVGLCFFET